MARPYLVSSVGLALALAGCGGEDKGRPSAKDSSSETPDPCRAADGYEFRNLIDFEPIIAFGQPSRLAQCNPELGLAAGQQCNFYFNYDHAHSIIGPDYVDNEQVKAARDCVLATAPDPAVSDPALFVGSFNGTPIPTRCDAESSAFHITASNIAMCYGSNGRLGWGASVDVTFASALDASEWDGISMWVRKGSATSGSAIIFSVVDPYTGAGAQDPNTLEPYCISMEPAPGEPPVPDTEKCDAFGTAVTLRDDWTFVPALFSTMRQKGFGAASPLPSVDSSSISRMQILLGPGNWDVWIDDIALFRSPN